MVRVSMVRVSMVRVSSRSLEVSSHQQVWWLAYYFTIIMAGGWGFELVSKIFVIILRLVDRPKVPCSSLRVIIV